MAMRTTDQPWSRIAEILGISEAEVMLNVEQILSRYGMKELNKSTMGELTRKLRIAREPQQEKRGPSVTSRQMECLRLYARGLSYKEIAASLHLRNHQTVQNHVSVACQVLGIIKTGRFRLQRVQEYFSGAAPQQPTPPVVTLDDPAFQ